MSSYFTYFDGYVYSIVSTYSTTLWPISLYGLYKLKLFNLVVMAMT